MARSTASENDEATSAEGLRRKSPLLGRDPSGSQMRIAAVTSLACAHTRILPQFQNCHKTALTHMGCVLENHREGIVRPGFRDPCERWRPVLARYRGWRRCGQPNRPLDLIYS